jgi:hypothetical protein
MTSLLNAGRVLVLASMVTSVGIAGGLVRPVPREQVAPDFENRIKEYVALRAKVDNDAPRRSETKDVAKIREAQSTLAALLRNARATAKQGDLFGPGITEKVREILKSEVQGPDGAKARASMEDEKAVVELKVNGDYPATQPLASVPPLVLQALPPLPKDQDLQYRLVGKHLILLDTRANLILDYVFNALP